MSDKRHNFEDATDKGFLTMLPYLLSYPILFYPTLLYLVVAVVVWKCVCCTNREDRKECGNKWNKQTKYG